jgi:hypothetical protein
VNRDIVMAGGSSLSVVGRAQKGRPEESKITVQMCHDSCLVFFAQAVDKSESWNGRAPITRTCRHVLVITNSRIKSFIRRIRREQSNVPPLQAGFFESEGAQTPSRTVFGAAKRTHRH